MNNQRKAFLDIGTRNLLQKYFYITALQDRIVYDSDYYFLKNL